MSVWYRVQTKVTIGGISGMKVWWSDWGHFFAFVSDCITCVRLDQFYWLLFRVPMVTKTLKCQGILKLCFTYKVKSCK